MVRSDMIKFAAFVDELQKIAATPSPAALATMLGLTGAGVGAGVGALMAKPGERRRGAVRGALIGGAGGAAGGALGGHALTKHLKGLGTSLKHFESLPDPNYAFLRFMKKNPMKSTGTITAAEAAILGAPTIGAAAGGLSTRFKKEKATAATGK